MYQHPRQGDIVQELSSTRYRLRAILLTHGATVMRLTAFWIHGNWATSGEDAKTLVKKT
jgi:hypothetical protein